MLCSAGIAEGDEAAGKGSHAAPAHSLQGGSLGRSHSIRPLHPIPPAGAPRGLVQPGPSSWLQLSAACTACYAQRVARSRIYAENISRCQHSLCSLQAAVHAPMTGASPTCAGEVPKCADYEGTLTGKNDCEGRRQYWQAHRPLQRCDRWSCHRQICAELAGPAVLSAVRCAACLMIPSGAPHNAPDRHPHMRGSKRLSADVRALHPSTTLIMLSPWVMVFARCTKLAYCFCRPAGRWHNSR